MQINKPRVAGAELQFDATGEDFSLGLGGQDAGRWLNTLTRPAATLADKLGLKRDARAYVIGSLEDEVLAKALVTRRIDVLQYATVCIASEAMVRNTMRSQGYIDQGMRCFGAFDRDALPPRGLASRAKATVEGALHSFLAEQPVLQGVVGRMVSNPDAYQRVEECRARARPEHHATVERDA